MYVCVYIYIYIYIYIACIAKYIEVKLILNEISVIISSYIFCMLYYLKLHTDGGQLSASLLGCCHFWLDLVVGSDAPERINPF
jgi:hypothetical protein